MITLNMQSKGMPVRIGTGHFSTENKILTLQIQLMAGAAVYDLTDKIVTAVFAGKPMTAPLTVTEGVIQLPITSDLISVGMNRIQIVINWGDASQEMSPIILWPILTPLAPGIDAGSVDILSVLISQCTAIASAEALRIAAEGARELSFAGLVDEYNLLKADLQEQITAGTASIDALELLEADYAARALTLETNYAPRLSGVETSLEEMTIQLIGGNHGV